MTGTSQRVTPEDLVSTLVRADTLRRKHQGQPLSKYRPSQRVFIEPFFNVLGLAFGAFMSALPWPLRARMVQWVNIKMAAHDPEPGPNLPQITQETVRLARDIQDKTRTWPAMLVFISHPDTMGPLQWLRFEILRQGLLIADAMAEECSPGAWYKPHPRCFLAIDPFALDTISPAVGGFYSGWMHRFYMAWDRQPSSQSFLQRHLLLRGTGYDRVIWRLLRMLRKNVAVLMALPGGLPYNARLLYAAREFINRLIPNHWPHPKRFYQQRMMEILMQSYDGVLPAAEGVISPKAETRIGELLRELGLGEGDIQRAMEELRVEFKLEVPYRQRLFRVLLKRLVERGKPLIFLGVGHATERPYCRIAKPWAVYRDATGGMTLARASIESASALPSIDQFGKAFVSASF